MDLIPYEKLSQRAIEIGFAGNAVPTSLPFATEINHGKLLIANLAQMALDVQSNPRCNDEAKRQAAITITELEHAGMRLTRALTRPLKEYVEPVSR